MFILLCAISFLFFISSCLGYTLFFKLVGYDTTRDKFATLFFSCLLGFLFVVCGYAVIVKGVYTLMVIPFVLLLIAALYFFSPKLLPLSKEVAPTLLLLLWFWTLYFNHLLNLSQDALFYSLMAKALHILPENYFLTNNLLSTSFNGTTPYHYGEMWTTNLLCRLLKYDSVVVLTQIVYPFLSFMCLLGIIASTSASLPIWKRIGYGITLIFATSIFYSLKPHFFIQGLNLYLFNITSEVFFKILFILPLSIASAWWLKRRADIASILLFQIPFFSFITAPAVYGGSFLALLILLWRKTLSLRSCMTLLLLLVTHVVALAGFYALTPSPKLEGWRFSHLYALYSSHLSYSLTTFRNILIGQPLFLFLSFLPCFGLFFLFKPSIATLKEHQLSLLLSGCIVLCGIIAFGILFPVRDSVQLVQVVWIAVSFILLLTILASAPLFKSSYLIAILSLTLVYIGFTLYTTCSPPSTYSPEFTYRINTSLKGRPILKIGSIRKENGLESYFMYLQPISPFKDLPRFWGCIPMTLPRPLFTDALTKFRALDIEQESAFYEYVAKKNRNIWSIKPAQWEKACCHYADSLKLDAIIVENGAPLPFCLRQKAKQEIVDSVSKEHLIVF